jgi:hypothetical protein
MVISQRHDRHGIIRFPSTSVGQADAFAYQPDSHEDTPDPRAPIASTSRTGPAIEVEVRRARASDLISLPRFAHLYELNSPETPQSEIQPMRSVLRGSLPFWRYDHPVFVASTRDDHRLLGMAQFREVGPDQRWMATCIRTDSGVYEDDPIVIGLLHHAIQDAGFNGIKRLYAKADLNSPVRASLRAIGFAPYMTETILVAPNLPLLPVGTGVRTLEQADVWAVHQLYIQTTPRDVQYAEAFTSHNWDVGIVNRDRGHDGQGWIITRDFVAVAYARAVTHREAHHIDFMVVPECRDLLPGLLAQVFRTLGSTSSRRVYISVRAYQREEIALLETMGFVVQLEQELNVRYTTASVRSSVLSVESFAHEGVRDPATKRVPSFFQREKQPDPAYTIAVKRPVVPSDPTHVSGGSE